MKLFINFLRYIFGLLLLTLSTFTFGQCPTGFPDKPINLIVPFSAGGTSDIVARLMARKLSEQMGKSWVVENKPGGGASIGGLAVVKAAPDGYTLLLGAAGPLTMSPHITNLPYNIQTQLMPLALVTEVPNLIAINNSVPANNLSDLIKLAQNSKPPLSYGSAGIGSTANFAGEYFKSLIKSDITHVPYKGTSAAVTDLVGKQITFVIDNLPGLLPQVKNGSIKAIALASNQRSPELPNTPTAIEAGLKGFIVTGWFGFLAPANTPNAIANCLTENIIKAAQDPETSKSLVDAGNSLRIKGSKDFARYIEEESNKWKLIAEKANIKSE
jgi:tripartite-type tricarboxylate transporter receptor subunit TctC